VIKINRNESTDEFHYAKNYMEEKMNKDRYMYCN